MIELDPKEIAQVLWETNQPQAGPLGEQGEQMQGVYGRAAEAVIGFLAKKAAEEPVPPPYPADLLDLLAEALAWKLLHPQQLSESSRDVLDQYEREVGRQNVPDIVAKAIAEL